MLLPDLELPFDDEKLVGCTVADVLANPDNFVNATLADPLEGVEYGRCVAKILRRSSGEVFIHSFAHGRTIYELKRDGASVRKAMERVAKAEVVKLFAGMAVDADLDAVEREELRQLAKQLSGVGLGVIDSALEAMRETHAAQQAQERLTHQRATRCDPRPALAAPYPDDPWLPVMAVINEVLGAVDAAIPPLRDADNACTQVRKRPVPGMHAFTTDTANAEEEEE